MKLKTVSLAACVGALFMHATPALAQAAGADPDFNKQDRAKVEETIRLDKVDPPVQPDPVGNAIVGGIVTGSMQGAAAGAASAVRGAAVGSAIQATKEDIKKSKEDNAKTGRGSESDPRYNPKSIFDN